MKKSEIQQKKLLIMPFSCSTITSGQYFQKTKILYLPKDVFYKICKYQQGHTFIKVRKLSAITYVSEILIFAFRPHPREIEKKSHNQIRKFDLSKVPKLILVLEGIPFTPP